MAFVKKTWKDRVVQYANRRLLTKSGGEIEQVVVTRDEGTVTEAGDKFDAATMNDLEDRLEYAFDNVSTAIECTQAEYDTWKNAGQLKPQTSYIITDAPNLNPTASDIEYSSGVTVKQAIDSKANTSSLSTVATSGSYNDLSNKPIHFRGTLGLDVLQTMKDLPDNSICCYTDSNNPTNQPTGHAWGSYFMYKTNGGARAYYTDNDCFAVSGRVTSSSTTLTWKIFT